MKRLFRIATLFAPTIGAWIVAITHTHRDALTRAVSLALGPLWIVLGVAFLLRLASVLVRKRRPVLEHLDVLTSAGVVLAWLSGLAIVGAVTLGWASFAAIGMLGTGVFHVVVLYAFVALRGDPFARGSITRTFTSETITEGDAVHEELALLGVPIPIGYRLFLSGRIGPRWATARHVIEATESEADITLSSEVGPAVRGVHEAEPIAIWLEDTFGLCRSLRAERAPAKVTVLPKLRPLDNPIPLRDLGIGARMAKHAPLPTEGSFNLREYQSGDDVRRIHWVRSLAAGELIVRLPDELPPDLPRVRIVLDTCFPEAFALGCDAPAEMLDSLVATWLGLARSIAESGVRATLVASTADGVKRLEYAKRRPDLARALGAQIAWQGRVPVDELLTDEATLIVTRGIVMTPIANPKHRWVIVAPTSLSEPVWNLPSEIRTPFPMGHPENRMSVRRKRVRELISERQDFMRAMRVIQTNLASPPPGSFSAIPTERGPILVRPR